jgi:2-oxoisovalerate dehydrogenase E1 component
MAKLKKLKPVFDWAEVVADETDWAALSPVALRNLLFQMYLVRRFEQNLLELKKNNLIHGPVHTSIGQEAVAVGTMAALRRTDGIGGTHRAHHQYLTKACSFHLAPEFDAVTDELPAALKQAMATLLAEIMGLDAGCCRGRGGSMHLCDPTIGVLGTNAIVGGGIPLAAGAAFSEKYRKSGNVVVSFFGDGATNQGAFHEALNLAGLWKLPVIYVLENNGYAVATSLAESSAVTELSVRAAGYGMTGRVVDGNNVLAVKAAITEAAQALRGGDAPPVFIEMKTYRDFHHAGDIPGSAFGYRSREEEQEWKQRDPVETFKRDLLARGFLTAAQDAQLQQRVAGIVVEATGTCVEAGAIKTSLLPAPSSIAEGLRGSGAEFAGVAFTEPGDVPGERKKMKYVEAIAAVTGRWLENDPAVFVLGEEVGHMTGGPYLATKGLAKRFPGRVLDTPISEAGFCGLAGGAAMNGLRPVVEIMFPDFALVAADQLFNQIGKLRHMYGGRKVEMPVVVRTRIAVGCGYGGQHSMDPTALFALFSGWRIVVPSTAADYVGLFNTAMRCNDPVLIVEHHEQYNQVGEVPENLDYHIPFGKARLMTTGSDVTVLTHSFATTLVTQAAAELAAEGISVEAVDLRTVSMPDIDYALIGKSFAKTGSLVIVEQSPASNSIGARIGYECQRRFFDQLDGPIATVTAADIPTPVSKWAEAASLPSLEQIKATIRQAATRQL